MLCPSGETNRSIELYLDLMKRCLTDSIFIDDPLAFFVPYREKPQMTIWKRSIVKMLHNSSTVTGFAGRALFDPWTDHAILDRKACGLHPRAGYPLAGSGAYDDRA